MVTFSLLYSFQDGCLTTKGLRLLGNPFKESLMTLIYNHMDTLEEFQSQLTSQRKI